MSSPGSLLLFYTAWRQDTFVAYDQSYTFAQLFIQPDGVNCVVRSLFWGGVPKTSSAVSGLWMLTVAST